MNGKNTLQIYAGFMNLIELLDNYKLFKNLDGTYAIDAELKEYTQCFKSNTIEGLMKLVGKWLCKLPKDVWVGMEKQPSKDKT